MDREIDLLFLKFLLKFRWLFRDIVGINVVLVCFMFSLDIFIRWWVLIMDGWFCNVYLCVVVRLDGNGVIDVVDKLLGFDFMVVMYFLVVWVRLFCVIVSELCVVVKCVLVSDILVCVILFMLNWFFVV